MEMKTESFGLTGCEAETPTPSVFEKDEHMAALFPNASLWRWTVFRAMLCLLFAGKGRHFFVKRREHYGGKNQF